jgi:hypothetical protein
MISPAKAAEPAETTASRHPAEPARAADEALAATHTRRGSAGSFQKVGRLGLSASVALAWAGVAAALAALAVAPRWPVRLVEELLWFGGAWRTLALPAALALAAAALAANAAEPGRTTRCLERAWARLRAWLPGSAAAVIFLLAIGYQTGLLSFHHALWALVLLALQVALFPHTPLIAALALLALATLAADARGERLAPRLHVLLAPPLQRLATRLRACWPPAAAAGAAALFAAALFPSAMQGWARADPPDANRYSFYSSFFNYAISDDRIVQLEGFTLGELGLMLAPGASGTIAFRLERPPESIVLLKANFYNRRFGPGSEHAPTFENAIELSTDQGSTYATVAANASFGEVLGTPPLDLTPFLGASRSYRLRFRATNTTSEAVTVLPALVVSVVADPLALPDGTFPVVAYGAVAAALAALALPAIPRRALSRSGIAAGAAAAGCIVALAAALAAKTFDAGMVSGVETLGPASGTERALIVSRAGTALVALASAAALWRSGERSRRALPVACLLAGIVALDARWTELMRLRTDFLLPDAQGYQAIAAAWPQKLAHYEAQHPSALLDQLYAAGFDGRASVPAVFYAGGNNGREPLWPATLRLVYNVFGNSAFHSRLTSLGFGVAVAVLTCWLGWRLLHPLIGTVGGLLLALNRPHIVNSVAGLREELLTVLFLVLIAALFAGRPRGRSPAWWRLALAGAAAAGVVLVRADMVVLAGIVVTAAALALRWPWRAWLSTVLVMGLLAGPMYIGYWFTHGDPFYPGTYGATVNRNLEFPERMGTPGFPTPEEYAANWAAGPKISPMAYFFGYHTPRQFLEYMGRGFWRIFRDVLFEQQPVLLWLFVAGFALLVAARRWVVPFAILAGLLPFYAFLAGVPNPWVFAGRYAHHVLPFAELAAATAICAMPIGLWRIIQRRPVARRLPSIVPFTPAWRHERGAARLPIR